jgi:hypothetical protein
MLEPAAGGFHPRSLVAAGSLLPTDAPSFGDTVEVMVARRRIGLGGFTRNLGGAWRHDDRRNAVP